jgi:hypothetical protein
MALSAAVALMGANIAAMAPTIGNESPIPLAMGLFNTGNPRRVTQLSRTRVLIIWGSCPATGTSSPVRGDHIEQGSEINRSKKLLRGGDEGER